MNDKTHSEKSSASGGPIVFIITSLYPGGAERLLLDDIRELLRRGLDVRLITLHREKAGKSFSADCSLGGENWQVIHFAGFWDPISLARLYRLLKRWKPSAVFTHLWLANTVGRVAAWLARINIIIAFEHNVYDTVKSRRHFFIDRVLAPLTTRIIAVSESVKKSLVRHGISESRISIIINGLDLKPYRLFDRKEARARLGFANDEFIFLFAGRFTRQKGLDVLLEAFSKLEKGRLILVGDGEERSHLEALAKELGIAPRVAFTGFMPHAASALAAADCFVLPSRWEGLPIALLEAFAAGRAVVASDLPNMREVAEHGKNALLVPPENAEALAEAMCRIMTDPVFRGGMERINLVHAGDFSIEYHVRALLEYIS
ncbi:MAG: glycosyltransferase [bacterium]|nr:glycosyltransferase [bacterium]